MRFVVVTLALCAVAITAPGCRRRAESPPPPSMSPSAARAAGAPPTSGAVPAALPAPPSPWRPSVDCDKLLGAARASKVMGQPLVANPASAGDTVASECRYTPPGTPAGAAAPSALVEVIFACRETAAPIARSVMSRLEAGHPAAAVGQQGVLLAGDGGRGIVQFLDRGSPCAVQVTTLPGAHALDVAREVASTLGAVRVSP